MPQPSRKHIEINYTIDPDTAETVVQAQRLHPDDERVTLFADEGGIVAVVLIETKRHQDSMSLDEALYAVEAELEEHMAYSEIPDPWRMTIIDTDRMTQNLLRGSVPVEDEGDGLEGAEAA